MNYGELQANVESAMGRSDIPSYVYTLTTAGLNADPDLRLLEMQSETTLTASAESVSLPADFLSVESVYIDAGGARRRLIAETETAQAVHHDSSGQPYYFSVHNGELTLMPVPDAEYTITLRYYARLADLSADSDTNDVLTNYPQLYMYQAMIHAAMWAQDDEGVVRYSGAYTSAKTLAIKNDIKRRFAGPMVQRSAVQL